MSDNKSEIKLNEEQPAKLPSDKVILEEREKTAESGASPESKLQKEEEKGKLQEDMRKLIEQNTEFEQELKKDIAKGPPISAKATFAPLLAEYGKNKYFAALESLSKSFTYIRRARRDGNCFYRSYLIQMLEFMNPHKGTAGGALIEEKLKNSKDLLLAAAYDSLVFEDSYDLLMNELEKLKKSTPENFESILVEIISNPDTSNYLLLYVRLITAAYIRTHPEVFLGFVAGNSIDEYCRMEIEHFDYDCDHVQILALTSYMEVGVTIYAAREEGKIEIMKFPDSAKDYPISMLLLPGHYDPIYPS